MEKDHRPYPKAAKGPMTEGLLKKLTRAPQLYWRMFILAGAGKHTKKKEEERKGEKKKVKIVDKKSKLSFFVVFEIGDE